MEKKYVWINIETGEFSNSWNTEMHASDPEFWSSTYLQQAKKVGYRLIEYTCLNDDKFEFYNQMKLK